MHEFISVSYPPIKQDLGGEVFGRKTFHMILRLFHKGMSNLPSEVICKRSTATHTHNHIKISFQYVIDTS